MLSLSRGKTGGCGRSGARMIGVALTLSGMVLLLSCTARAELRAGSARVDITPDVKASHVPLGGYAARRGAASTGVHDPVYARAVVLTNGKTKVAIVSLDLCFLPANIKTDVQARLKASGTAGYDDDALFLAATHTHSGPDPLAMHQGNRFKANGWTSYDAGLRAFTASRIAEAVAQADHRLAPAEAGSAVQDDTEGLNRNRRHDPVVDPAMTAVRITGTDGAPIADIVDFASHPTLYGDEMLEISADWPGVMTADIERSMGAGGVCLFLNGAEGDASPNGVDDLKGDAKVAEYGHRVSREALHLLGTISPQKEVALSIWRQMITLPKRKPTAMFIIAAGQLGLESSQARALVNDMMPETTNLSFVHLGDLLLIGFPCEPSGILGLTAKAAAINAGYARPVVVALVNDWLAYALTPDQYHAGKYESMMSFYGDQFGPTLLTAVTEGLKARP